jgi:mono/diheme cytochrome c family protein
MAMRQQWGRLVIGAALSWVVGAAPLAADAAKGKEIYAAAMPKCKVCHSVGGEGNVKGKLDGVGSRLSADDIKAWMRTPKEMTEKAKATRKPFMPAYPKEKMSDADLQALTDYMLSLK